jgi:hypothetical protein
VSCRFADFHGGLWVYDTASQPTMAFPLTDEAVAAVTHPGPAILGTNCQCLVCGVVLTVVAPMARERFSLTCPYCGEVGIVPAPVAVPLPGRTTPGVN